MLKARSLYLFAHSIVCLRPNEPLAQSLSILLLDVHSFHIPCGPAFSCLAVGWLLLFYWLFCVGRGVMLWPVMAHLHGIASHGALCPDRQSLSFAYPNLVPLVQLLAVPVSW